MEPSCQTKNRLLGSILAENLQPACSQLNGSNYTVELEHNKSAAHFTQERIYFAWGPIKITHFKVRKYVPLTLDDDATCSDLVAW